MWLDRLDSSCNLGSGVSRSGPTIPGESKTGRKTGCGPLVIKVVFSNASRMFTSMKEEIHAVAKRYASQINDGGTPKKHPSKHP